jgi:iron complex outermembrane receptor protein
MKRVDRLGRLLLAGAATIAFATPAFAQSAEQTNQEAQQEPAAPPATGAPNAEGQDTATGEIVVTARRTEERLQRVPSSVSAFTERTLDRIQATDTTGLQGAVPNLNIVQGRGSSNATNIYIRGVGQPDALQTFDPAVGVYIDDVYLSRIRGTQLDLLDVERIEVLRGPQGTLYGKNTIGGAFKVITRKPGQDTRINGTVAIGSYNQLEFRGAASGAISPTLAAGFAVMRAQRDGFVEDYRNDREYNDRDTIGARGSLAFTPSERLRFDVSADYSEDEGALNVGQPINSLKSLFLLPLPVTRNLEQNGYNFEGTTTNGLPNSTKLQHRGISGILSYDLTDALTLKSITAFRKLDTEDYIDIDATEYEVGDVFVDVDQKQFSQELQLAYSLGALSGVAGVYYLKENVGSHQEAYADDYVRPVFTAFTRFIDDDLKTRSLAAYANASIPVTTQLRISAGLRYTHERKDYDRNTYTIANNLIRSVDYRFNPEGSWTDLSPSLSVDYQLTPDAMIYGRVAKGFKSGGFNGRANTAGASTEYDPETVISYEAGFKSRIAQQLTLNGAVFHNDYRDFQARVGSSELDPIFGTQPVLSVLNAGKLQIRGAELEAAWTPLSGLLLDSQIGYLDAEYKEFEDVRFPGGSRAFQTPAFSPKWTMRFGAQYALSLGTAGSLTVSGQSRYRSRAALAVDSTFVNYPTIGSPGVGTTQEVPGLFQNSYWLHDARIVWEDPGKRFAVGLYGNNLTDKVYKTDAQEFSSVGEIRTVYYGAPRTFTLRLTARY